MVTTFSFSKVPEIHFGIGRIEVLSKKIKQFGKKTLLVTGKSSFIQSGRSKSLLKKLETDNIKFEIVNIPGEPSVSLIDEICNKYRLNSFDAVVSIGGGSVIDAGKAISAMLPEEGSVKLFLEGNPLGRPHPGIKIPFIAVPTTAGTGSETTKNAVLSEVGENGFKSSLRHEHFIPEVAIVDPELSIGCPPGVTAASGLDAFTQLFESYISLHASTLSDVLAYEGMYWIVNSLNKVIKNGNDISARSNMSYAAMLSGITLTNAGLGTVHGFASAIGSFFEIPHGIVCGSLLGEVNKKNIEKLQSNKIGNGILSKYSKVGELFCNEKNKSEIYYQSALGEALIKWIEELKIPKLGKYGITKDYLEKIISKTDNKNNPVNLNKDEWKEILMKRI
jgi:alcohol dehydrogenase class IV